MIQIHHRDRQRFLTKIIKTSNCWLWDGGKSNGYGYFWLNSRNYQAHRVAYILFKGNITEELELDHLCRNRRCVNPDHLEAVTPQVNKQRTQKEHCKNGHPFDETNTRISSTTGRRVCRACARNWAALHYIPRKQPA